jgi:hypothetical protein
MPLAKPNYAFQKRQRELAKKQKKEEKRLRKTDSPPEHDAGAVADDGAGAAPGAGMCDDLWYRCRRRGDHQEVGFGQVRRASCRRDAFDLGIVWVDEMDRAGKVRSLEVPQYLAAD